MMSISKLKPYFDEDEIDETFNKTQVDQLFELFKEDFVYNSFEVGGKRVKIIHQKSRISQYSEYGETFVHIITRELKSAGGRLYDCKRANRIHWIKPILLAHSCKDILYYRWRDDKGVCKHHYWYFDKNFMVVAVDVGPDLRIITTFCVDNDSKGRYYERYKDFLEGKDCA